MSGEVTGAPAAGETPIVSKGNSAVSFNDLEQMENAEARAKREKKSESQPKKAKAPEDQKESKTEATGPLDTGSPGKKPVPAPKKDAPKAAKDGEDGEAGAQETKDSERPRKPAKVHKFRSGDDEHELSGDAIVTHTVNGKEEEIPLQELLNNYSGKVDYSRKYGEFGKEKDQFKREKQELEGFVQDFFQRSQGDDPSAAWDLLAEAAKTDPVEFREKMLRGQMAQLEAVLAMEPDERERWIHEQKVGWRERIVNARDKAQQQTAAKAQQTGEIATLRDKYGLDEESWGQNYLQAKKLVNGKEPSPTQVVAASRYMMVFEAIKNAAPELENHPKYDTLVHSYVDDLMKTPSISKSQFENLLKEVWVKEDDTNLKKVSKKAIEQAEANGTDLRSKPKAKSDKDPWNFDQL